MKKTITFCFTILCINSDLFAQNTYLISFVDKPSIANFEASRLLTKDALFRRTKDGVKLDDYDTPINSTYISALKNEGVIIKGKSKWLNTVLVETNLSNTEIQAISSNIKNIRQIDENSNKVLMSKKKSKFSSQTIDYGLFQPFAEKYDVPYLHDEGFQGENIKVAIIDVGFKSMDTSSYFTDLFTQSRIKDTWNFWTDSTDVYVDHGHGTYVSSYILANTPGSFVGLAPQADVYLYLTDKIDTETPQDEFKLVEALERADSLGVEIINLSLAYQYFDNSNDDYQDQDKDGLTAISTLGVNIAANKGILIMSGVGNEAVRACPPSDAFGILGVGGTYNDFSYDSYSNVGPSYDGRQKPEVSAITRNIYSLNTEGQSSVSNYGGTSGATPQITGIAICLKQKHPNATKDELRLAIINSAHIATTPNSYIGHGVPSAFKADSLLQVYLSIEDYITIENVNIFPNPSIGYVQIRHPSLRIEQIQVHDVSGKNLLQIKGNEGDLYNFSSFPNQTLLLSIIFENGVKTQAKIVIN